MPQPPARINVMENTVAGWPLRLVIILSAGGVLALAILIGLPGLDLIWRGALVVLVAGMAVAFAFGDVQGQKPETWLLQLLAFRRRSRYMVKGAQAQAAGPRVALAPAETSKPKPQPKPKRLPLVAEAVPFPSFFALSFTAVCVAYLTGLTLYLLAGGAAQLSAMVKGF